jgi:ATP-dependent protease Clp ATPase subunit
MTKNGMENMPTPKELEKEIGEFLSKRFGENVKLMAPIAMPQKDAEGESSQGAGKGRRIEFDLKPEDLIAHLDHYIIKQDRAKAVLATKICTHFNRIRHTLESPDRTSEMVGRIKNNVLMIGPTGVGKTYMV